MPRANFEALLKRTMGLHTPSIGSPAVERAVQARQSACDLAGRLDYWERLRESQAELQALIEMVVVPETWFFRDREACVELARMTRDEWLRDNPQGVLRLLSVPCSTGEEPYSMAMALLDVDIPDDRFSVDAVDISERALAHARRAVYGGNSFRGADLAFRERHFETTPHGQRLSDTVRQSVHFQQGNILASDFLAAEAPYDAIFCRNLLIYFDQATQDKVVAVLQRLLASDGVVFVGPAETGLLLNCKFESARVPLAFAFRKPRPAAPAAPCVPSTIRPAAPAKAVVRAATRSAHGVKRAKPPTQPPPSPEPRMDKAFALADQGHLMDAAELCEQELREHGPSVPALYLMGLICAADGRMSAANRYYRKALYLDKSHYDTLVHLALLLERQGDAREAMLLRARAHKL